MAFLQEQRINLGIAASPVGGFPVCGGMSNGIDSFNSAGSSACGLHALQGKQVGLQF